MTIKKDDLFQGDAPKEQQEQPKQEVAKAVQPVQQTQPPKSQEPAKPTLSTVPQNWTQSLQIAQSRMKQQNIWDEKRIMRELGFARGALEKNQQLRECSAESILNALLQCCRLGMTLNPALKLAALVAYGKECNFMMQYQGLIATLKEVNAVKSMKAVIVYQDEVDAGCFSYNPAEDKMLHDPIYAKTETEQKTRAIYGVYSVAVLPDGTREIYFMPEWMVLKRKAVSKSASSSYSPWNQWNEEMFQKTVIRRHFNFLAKVQHSESDKLSDILEHEDKLADYEDKSGNTNVGGRFAEYTTVD